MTTPLRGRGLVARLLHDFDAALDRHPGAPRRSPAWWAAYEPGVCDPYADIAEAAARVEVARLEGAASYRTYAEAMAR